MSKAIWKYDQNGNERPLQEQLLRRKGDLYVIQMHISFYDKHPFYKNDIQRKIASNSRIEIQSKIYKDIRNINKRQESSHLKTAQ